MPEECPYCGKSVKINHDDGYGYAAGKLHDQQCPHCDKYFVYQTTIDVYHELFKATCLNDGEHKFEITKCYPKRFAVMRCTECGEEKPLPEDVLAKIIEEEAAQ